MTIKVVASEIEMGIEVLASAHIHYLLTFGAASADVWEPLVLPSHTADHMLPDSLFLAVEVGSKGELGASFII